jgi:hypothetical protein
MAINFAKLERDYLQTLNQGLVNYKVKATSHGPEDDLAEGVYLRMYDEPHPQTEGNFADGCYNNGKFGAQIFGLFHNRGEALEFCTALFQGFEQHIHDKDTSSLKHKSSYILQTPSVSTQTIDFGEMHVVDCRVEVIGHG